MKVLIERNQKFVSGDCRFVLAGFRHLAGVINPQKEANTAIGINDELPDSAQDWLGRSIRTHRVLGGQMASVDDNQLPMAPEIKALQPGKSKHHPSQLWNAPGETYVLKRLVNKPKQQLPQILCIFW